MVVAPQRSHMQKRTIQCALGVSFLLHALVMVARFQQNTVSPSSAREKVTKVQLVEPEEIQQAVEAKRIQAKIETKRQIVTSEKSDVKLAPVPTRFLSEHNQAVDRQTVSKQIGSFKEAGKGQKQGSETIQQKTAKAQTSAKETKVSLAALGQVKVHKSIAPKKAEREISSLGLENGRAGLAGLARNNDFVEDVPLGDMTKLNTVEFKYYGFYHRIKQRLEQHWGRTLQEKAENMVKRGRRAPASQDRITALSITLDNQGKILDIELRSSSGVSEFDEAAIDSFNKAGPFPNPPQGMMVNGKAKIEWGFVVKS